eukprot:TRINITY_DN5332_c0_g1_i1.p1 TRINITY_DN5332_c0_g1~~TRINITY_DN5332_c0_g1_i1.p1  ORF type:complete len:185 (-),score=42.62 TRINITY_DN5332_c0_g1_i1:154-708(-)
MTKKGFENRKDKTQSMGVLAVLTEYDSEENKRIFKAALEISCPKFDVFHIFIPIDISDIDFESDERIDESKRYLYQFTQRLDELGYNWLTIVWPTNDVKSTLKDILEKYKDVKKIVFPKLYNHIKKSLKSYDERNIICYSLRAFQVSNTIKDKDYLTSSGTLKRKIIKPYSKNCDHSSLLSDFY